TRSDFQSGRGPCTKPVAVGVAPLPLFRRRIAAHPAAAAIAHAWNAVGAALLAERDRWALWLPVALGTGIGVYFALPLEPSRAIGFALGAAGLLIAVSAALSPEMFLRA